MDIPQFNEDMNALLSVRPSNFHGLTLKPVRGNTKAKCWKLGKKDILVIEGIHCLNDAMSLRTSEGQ